jgi:alginate O-acetyltransferase complex protein AlgI
MVFSSTVFLFLFLPLAGYYNPLWLLASLGFYAWGELAFVFVMALAIVVNWALVLAMARHKEQGAAETLARGGHRLGFFTFQNMSYGFNVY